MAPRKKSEVWNAVKDKCPDGVDFKAWKSTYEGIKTALGHLGLELVTTKEEYEAMETPRDNRGRINNMLKKIIVSRNNIKSSPSQIGSLLCGQNSMLTKDELKNRRDNQSKIQKENQPKGETVYNNYEKTGIDNLHNLLQIESSLKPYHTLEFRRADVIYCKRDDDIDSSVFAADQVKVAHVSSTGRVHFNHSNNTLKVKHIIEFIENNMSLTCIGMTENCNVQVVWFFYGREMLDILKTFDRDQNFIPMLRMVRNVSNPFTIAINDTRFRYDVTKVEDRIRLTQAKINWVDIAEKKTAQFYNEDESQIGSENHKIEQRSFVVINNALMSIGKTIYRGHENNYTATDFTIDGCRIQSKVGVKDIKMRVRGRYPYNPNDIDIIQMIDVSTKVVFAIPTRKYEGEQVVCVFDKDELMKFTIKISTTFKERFKDYVLNLNDIDDIKKYYKICQESKNIPSISDDQFYESMIKDNKDMFFSNRPRKSSNP